MREISLNLSMWMLERSIACSVYNSLVFGKHFIRHVCSTLLLVPDMVCVQLKLWSNSCLFSPLNSLNNNKRSVLNPAPYFMHPELKVSKCLRLFICSWLKLNVLSVHFMLLKCFCCHSACVCLHPVRSLFCCHIVFTCTVFSLLAYIQVC